MKKYPVKLAERARARPVRKMESGPVDVLAPASRTAAFLSFRYSYTEMSVLGSKAHVKSRNARFEDGRLTSEGFEGELERSAYDRAVGDAQRQVVDQAAHLFKSFAWFLPFFGTHRSDHD
jgi:hypothetical protein